MDQEKIEETIEYCKEWKENFKTEEEIFYNGNALDIAIECMETVAKIPDVLKELRLLSFRIPQEYCGFDKKNRVVMLEDIEDIIKEKLCGGAE